MKDKQSNITDSIYSEISVIEKSSLMPHGNSLRGFSLILAQKHPESLLYRLSLKCPLCAVECDSVVSLCLAALYGAGARSSIRKSPSHPR